MLKIEAIQIIKAYKLRCFFNTGEQKIFDLEQKLDVNNVFVKKILNPNTFNLVKIGVLGQIQWDGIGEIKDNDGSAILCEYDISPEFVYFNLET